MTISLISLFGVFMLFAQIHGIKNQILLNLAVPEQDIEDIDGKIHHIDYIPANYNTIFITIVVGVLSLLFIGMGIVALHDFGWKIVI